MAGRKKVELTPLEINKINLLWFANGWNITSIMKSLKRSQGIIERNLFRSRDAWHEWSDDMMSKGLL